MTGAPAALPVPSVDAAPATQPTRWPHRHLLDLDVVSWPEIELVMRTAEAMKEVLARPIARVPEPSVPRQPRSRRARSSEPIHRGRAP